MKRYGIRMTLPPDDPMRAAHLLGAGWEAFRWYPTPAARDAGFTALERADLFSRVGDRQSLQLEKVDR